MDFEAILIIVMLVALLIGLLPNWGEHRYGYVPAALVAMLLIVELIFDTTGHL